MASRFVFRLATLVLAACMGIFGCSESRDDAAKTLCKKSLEEKLKSPASAQYPEIDVEQDLLASLDGGRVFKVTGRLDAANSFGALLRREFVCVVDFGEGSEPEVFSDLGERAELFGLETASRVRKKYHDRAQKKIRQAKRQDSSLAPPDVVGYDEFRRLREGMSLERVEQIIGHKGEKQPRKIEITPLGSSYQPTTYVWENYDGSSLLILFDNGKAQHLVDEGLW